MPVQENEKPKKEEFIEEKKPENSISKSQKLMPFLKEKAEFHQGRINNIDRKIAVKEDKISRNEAKIQQLSAKADRLEDRNTMLKNLLGSVPAVKKIIEANEKKIQNIRENKIPKRQEKIKVHKEKIAVLSQKRDVIEHKLNRVVALNDAIKSFSVGLNKERREIFSDAMNKLNTANIDCLSDKKNAMNQRKTALFEQYSSPETSVVDKLKIQAKIDDLSEKIKNIDAKIDDMKRPENHFSEQSEVKIDATMKVTSEKISEAVESENFSISNLAEVVFYEAEKVEKLDISEISALADDFEKDVNPINQLLENGDISEIQSAKNEIEMSISAMQNLIKNPYVAEDIRNYAQDNLADLQANLQKIDGFLDSKKNENWLENMLENGSATKSDGCLKVNIDFYNSVPPDERFVKKVTVPQAEKVMNALVNANIEFSAVTRENGDSGIMVSRENAPILQQLVEQSAKELSQEIHIDSRAEKPDFTPINPDFYKSLSNENRSVNIETRANAEKIMSELSAKNIQFSAVECKNNNFAITVAKADENAYKSVADAVKNERAVQYVNPEFFKSLPKEERATQSMPQAEAEQKIAELSQKNIPHSAVLNGEKSAVTVAKKDAKTAFFSRDKLKQTARKVAEKPHEQKKSQTKKQGLE